MHSWSPGLVLGRRMSDRRRPARCSATAAGVGWSKTRVAGSRSPVAAFSRLRSSSVASELESQVVERPLRATTDLATRARARRPPRRAPGR